MGKKQSMGSHIYHASPDEKMHPRDDERLYDKLRRKYQQMGIKNIYIPRAMSSVQRQVQKSKAAKKRRWRDRQLSRSDDVN